MWAWMYQFKDAACVTMREHVSRKEAEKADYSISRHPKFRYKTEFQSHEPEFDYLKSLEIEEKINKIKWCQETNGASFLLSTNDKTISFGSDGETFIPADDLRINLWNLEISNQSFNIVDVKPTNMEDLTEVITSAEFHPSHCNMLAYSSSKGSIRLVDLRQSALCDTHSKLFEQHESAGSRSFFTEIIGSISDIKFSMDGRHILSHDYMTLKLWDVNMDSGLVATFQVHEYLRPKLCDLYENDSIFDKFECCQSGDGLRVATGSYSNIFCVFNCGAGDSEVTTLEATRNPTRRQAQNPARPVRSMTRNVRRENTGIDANGNSYDLSTKLLHLAWHPAENLIACAAANSLYMYYG
ncbi:hypothetical protein ACQ4PT_025839 [Festuca glaucescens]